MGNNSWWGNGNDRALLYDQKPMSRVVQLLEGDFVQTEGLFKDPFHYAGNL